MTDLHQKSCVPCRGDTPTLPEDTITQYMEIVEGWERKENTIEKTFVFKNFEEARLFFNLVADIAEEEDHHPNMCINNWRKATFSLTTHAAHGLTENDFVVAAKINHLYSSAH